MPNKGDEFHHFGWNACSSALSPLFCWTNCHVSSPLFAAHLFVVAERERRCSANREAVTWQLWDLINCEAHPDMHGNGHVRPHTATVLAAPCKKRAATDMCSAQADVC